MLDLERLRVPVEKRFGRELAVGAQVQNSQEDTNTKRILQSIISDM
jgi:hypothetical protein|tara:strand:- start:291 stop:428 length:138 start_codon:yes stop_codon:yes gene_type:complete